LIAFTFIIRFQQDDRPILFDAIAHVETNTSLLQMALQDVRAMLPQNINFHVPPFESLVV
jgi:uncharacterized membrane-anchored protein